MKIVHVVAHFPPFMGGMQNSVLELAQETASIGHDVEIFTSDIRCKTNRIASTSNLKIHYLRSIEVAHSPIMFSLLFRLLFLPTNSIIHLHVAQALLPEVVWLVSKIRKFKVVAQVHLDVPKSGMMGFLLPFYKKFILKPILQSSSKVVVPTSDYVTLISNLYRIPQSKIDLIPYGVHVDKFIGPVTKRHPASVLVFVGRLTVQKNVEMLIDVFEELVNRGHTGIHLNIVGDGEDRQKIVSKIKSKNLTKRITMYGEIRGGDVREVLKKSDIFLLPSRQESFGIVLVEAMAAGTAVVASDILGVRNVVKSNFTGVLVKPDIESFANAVENIIVDDSFRNKIVKNGLAESVKYKWGNITLKFISVYKSISYEAN